METNEECREEIERILKNLNKNTYQYQEVVRKASKAGNPPLINLATSLGRKFVKHCRDTSNRVFNPCLKSDVVKGVPTYLYLEGSKKIQTSYTIMLVKGTYEVYSCQRLSYS